ncbi:MAG: hypothetical protein ACT4OS_07830 [Acidimicrobiales bacterium]
MAGEAKAPPAPGVDEILVRFVVGHQQGHRHTGVEQNSGSLPLAGIEQHPDHLVVDEHAGPRDSKGADVAMSLDHKG